MCCRYLPPIYTHKRTTARALNNLTIASLQAAVKAAEEAERSKAREERDRKEAAKKEVKQVGWIRARVLPGWKLRLVTAWSVGAWQMLGHAWTVAWLRQANMLYFSACPGA